MRAFIIMLTILSISCADPDEEFFVDAGEDASVDSSEDTETGTTTEEDSDIDSASWDDSETGADTDTEEQQWGDPCGDNPWRCDPVNNDCNSGYSCDWGIDVRTMVQGFYCMDVGPVELGGECNLEDGPFCGPGMTCTQSNIGSPKGTCVNYCCGDEECQEGFSCGSPILTIWRMFVTSNEFGMCLDDNKSYMLFNE